VLAVALQSRCSEVFAVDIHPAAKIGRGVLLDHGTGVVIGETAHVGNNVSILQNVTLGGTGKEHGDRHPKVSDNVLIGASATILGNILIGKGAQVAAGSLVLKPVPPKTMVAGSPAKEVGTISGNPALSMNQWRENSVALAGSETTSKLEEPCDDIFAAAPKPSTSNGATAKKEEREKSGTRIIDGQAATIVNGVSAEAASRATASTAPVEDLKAAILNAAAQHEKNNRKSGAPPAMEEPVDSVLSDTAAQKKWGGKVAGDDDMEYII
jgi:serine O-acetyltransferase